MRYYLIGPYPPPLGGVSVFAYRYARLLRAQGHTVTVANPGRESRPRRLQLALRVLCDPRPAVFHLNCHDFATMLALILRPFGGQVVFWDHSGRFVTGLSGLKRLVFRRFLSRVDQCVLVAEHLRDYYIRGGYALPANVTVRSAFIPPPLDEEARIQNTYSQETRCFIEAHRPLIVSNAYRIAFHEGADLYGLDMCTDLVAGLACRFPNVGLLFALAEVGDEAHYERINRRIDELGIREHFHFMAGQRELWPLFRKADLMVRATATDGASVSIEEALYLGCPVVASDVSERAPGTVVFKNRDSADLVDKVTRVLSGAANMRTGYSKP